MKEALSQIRHSKSDRPVFTAEFLSRIKRLIVFNPLDQKAMEGISRKLITEMCQTWSMQRGKELEVPESLLQYLAQQAHQLNERSQGKEGGRIVRKLISDWIEARIQCDVSQHPGDYKRCATVTLEMVPPAPGAADALGTAPEI